MAYTGYDGRSPPATYQWATPQRSSFPSPGLGQSDQYSGIMSATYSPAEASRPAMFPGQGTSSSRASTFTVNSHNSEASATESQAFLNPNHKADSFHPSPPDHFVPYHSQSRRQFKRLLLDSSARWLVSGALCGAYLLTMLVYRNKGTLSDLQKRHFNAWTTAVSIALGLNIASSFKDMALNMRWYILNQRKRSLEEVDLILHCGSMTQLARLALLGKRPWRVVACVAWLFLNILAQTGVAMLSLTYSIDVDPNHVLFETGNVTATDMAHFYSSINSNRTSDSNEEYTAHSFGSLAYGYSLGDGTTYPAPGTPWSTSNDMLWVTNKPNTWGFVFFDSPATGFGDLSVFTSRTVEATANCDRHLITSYTAAGEITIKDYATKNLFLYLNYATTYAIDESDTDCPNSDSRCALVQAFELKEINSTEQSWYYRCQVSVGLVANSVHPKMNISDSMAKIAAGSIASQGFTFPLAPTKWQKATSFQNESIWGFPGNGDTTFMSQLVGLHAIGSIAGAAFYNPTFNFTGEAPHAGLYLFLKYPQYFYLIIGLVGGIHLFAFVLVAMILMANQVLVTRDTPLAMAKLLAPVVEELNAVIAAGGTTEKMALKQRMVQYGMDKDNKWVIR